MENIEIDKGPKKILLIDDDPAIRKLIRKILETAGFEVLEAPNGGTAILLMKENPDLVLQDLILPDITGYDLVQKLRAVSENPKVPILALSGFLERPDSPWDTSGGFNALLVKPVPAAVLLDAIMTNLSA